MLCINQGFNSAVHLSGLLQCSVSIRVFTVLCSDESFNSAVHLSGLLHCKMELSWYETLRPLKGLNIYKLHTYRLKPVESDSLFKNILGQILDFLMAPQKSEIC